MGFFVAKGKSVTSKRATGGMLNYGDEVKPEYLGGGDKAIAALLARDILVKAGKSPLQVELNAANAAKATAEKQRKAAVKKAAKAEPASDGA